MRILIAEDDVSIQDLLITILQKSGHETVGTSNGVEAWEVLQQPDAPRLLILDWVMPKMDGLELLHRIRTQYTHRPPYILMLTCKTSRTEIITGLESGADDYLAKPFDHGELRARIEVGRRLLEMRDMLAEKIEELQQALAEIKTLHGIIPICASCKQIRDDQGYWNQVETYIRNHTQAEFSHGLCPECIQKLYPDYARDQEGMS
jgi:DNA-binding response OmpR family regulator